MTPEQENQIPAAPEQNHEITAVIDAADIHTRDELHDMLSGTLCLPSWYGRNLDALYDCLSASPAEIRLCVRHPDTLRRTFGTYAEIFFTLLRRVETENPRFHLSLE